MSVIIWIFKHWHYTQPWASGGGRNPSLNLKIWHFLAKSIVVLFWSWKVKFHHFCPPPEKSLASSENPFLPPLKKSFRGPYTQGLINHGHLVNHRPTASIKFDYKLKWDRYLKQLLWFALKYFFGLRIKSLIALKPFGATFGIGGAMAPIVPPLATRLG